MNKEDKLIKCLEINNGYITTSELLSLNIYKCQIPYYIKKGIIERVSHGVYMDAKLFKDDYYILQKRYPDAIFSYDTSLQFLNLTNKIPSGIDITVPRNKKVRGNYNVHHVSESDYKVGIIDAVTPFGNTVKIYNAERCICDMLKHEKYFDLEIQNRILNYYFSSKNKNIKLLLEYAKKLNVYDKVNIIVGVMMKW